MGGVRPHSSRGQSRGMACIPCGVEGSGEGCAEVGKSPVLAGDEGCFRCSSTCPGTRTKIDGSPLQFVPHPGLGHGGAGGGRRMATGRGHPKAQPQTGDPATPFCRPGRCLGTVPAGVVGECLPVGVQGGGFESPGLGNGVGFSSRQDHRGGNGAFPCGMSGAWGIGGLFFSPLPPCGRRPCAFVRCDDENPQGVLHIMDRWATEDDRWDGR